MRLFSALFSSGDILTQLINLAKELNIKYCENEPMKNHTTFKIGGPAALMVFPESEAQVSRIVKCCRDTSIRLIAIGNGSNLLVSDKGTDACVMCMESGFSDIRLIDDETVLAQSGVYECGGIRR